jgi:capsular polysaccharide export protein
MLVFFAARNHHVTYFEQLRRGIGMPAVVVRHNRAHWPSFECLPDSTRGNIREIVRVKLRAVAQARPNHRLPWIVELLLNVLLHVATCYRILCYVRLFRATKLTWLGVWNGVKFNRALAIEAARILGAGIIYFENGLLPDTTTVDSAGVNYANSMPRCAEFYRALPPISVVPRIDLTPRAARRGKPADEPVVIPSRYIFVPFQVDVDSQILVYSPWIGNMRQFLDILVAVANALPGDMMFVIKEHPSSSNDYRDLHAHHPRKILFANANNTQQLIEHAQAVITINSTVGIEALMLGKPVITVGQAFYNIAGLVSHASDVSELRSLIAQCDSLSVDPDLTNRFLGFLRDEYCVAGNWKTPDDRHMRAVAARLRDIMTGRFQTMFGGAAK